MITDINAQHRLAEPHDRFQLLPRLMSGEIAV